MNDLIYINKNSLSNELCNDIINLFEQEEYKFHGHIASGINKNVKDTTDLEISSGGPHWDKINTVINKELIYNVKKYINNQDNAFDHTYKILSTDYLTTETTQIQKYDKNKGKYVYHDDFACNFPEKKFRVLTFIWYLNDVTEGGETEIKDIMRIKPEAGKLLLFPSTWTYPHRGNVPISNDKYIVTGWLWKHYTG
jgi:hypothetical protein